MTEPVDELTQLRPSHASVLLIDPIELAGRASQSARRARRRANTLVAGFTVVAVAVALVVGAVLLRPTHTMVAAPTPNPSGVPSAELWLTAGVDPADYSAPRVGVVLVVGESIPDQLCLGDYTAGTCGFGVKVSGLTWDMMPWRVADGARSYARATVFGTFDGSTFTATQVREAAGLSWPSLTASPKRFGASSVRLSCDVVVHPVRTDGGLSNEALAFPGLEAFWADPDTRMYMVAISGDLGTAVNAVQRSTSGPACVGRLPATGTLTDLVTAIATLNGATSAGVVSAELSVVPEGAAVEVHVVANVPGLREKLVALVGTSVPLVIDPMLPTLAS